MLCANNRKYTVIRRAAYFWRTIGSALREKSNYMKALPSSSYVTRYIKLPLDKTVRGTEDSSGNQGLGKVELSAFNTA